MATSGASVSWGAQTVSAAGGLYRLCWCAGAITCSAAEDFNTDVCALVIVGASPLQQSRTCISGRLCQLDNFIGQDLAATDVAMVLDTCGTNSIVPRFPDGGRFAPATMRMGMVEVTAAGGQYRLCWC